MENNVKEKIISLVNATNDTFALQIIYRFVKRYLQNRKLI